jgi:hypothetical protein
MTDHEITDATHSNENESHRNFLQVVYQVNNIACLFAQNDDGSLSAEYATPSLVALMECNTQEEALELMDGDNLFTNTWPEDRPILRGILTDHISADGELDITIRQTTEGKSDLVHYPLRFH